MSCAADIRGWRSPHLKSVYFWLERVHEIISRVGLFLKITPCSLLEEFILALHGCLFAGRHWSLQKDVNYKFSRARFKTRKCRWATLLQQQFPMSVFCFGGFDRDVQYLHVTVLNCVTRKKKSWFVKGTGSVHPAPPILRSTERKKEAWCYI